MGNENERKHNPGENRENWMGGGPDSAKKGGGDESNVGLTGPAGGEGGMGAGSGGIIGGSADFLTDEQPAAALGGQNSHENEFGAQHSGSGEPGFGARENMTDQQGGDTSFGGRTGSGSSFIASDSGQSDLGSAGVHSPEQGDENPVGDLASEDALDSEEDGGAGLEGGQSR